jgi:hypothetical protein
MPTKKWNPVLWLMWLIPGTAVVAGTSMVVVAMKGADRALPDIYHWEGAQLDADFERARQAVQLGLDAVVELGEGHCTVSLARPFADGGDLQLRLTSGNHASLDRTHSLQRLRAGVYRAACDPLPQGRWRVSLQDAANTWLVRTQSDAFTRLELRARSPEG